MKIVVFLALFLLTINYLSAQDTIPFMDPCFCYPDTIPNPQAGATNRAIGMECYQYPSEDADGLLRPSQHSIGFRH